MPKTQIDIDPGSSCFRSMHWLSLKDFESEAKTSGRSLGRVGLVFFRGGKINYLLNRLFTKSRFLRWAEGPSPGGEWNELWIGRVG